MWNRFSLQRTYSVARKELLHILRDPMTLFFTLIIPILQLFMLEPSHLRVGLGDRGVLRQVPVDDQLGPVRGRKELLLHEVHA